MTLNGLTISLGPQISLAFCSGMLENSFLSQPRSGTEMQLTQASKFAIRRFVFFILPPSKYSRQFALSSLLSLKTYR
jgi:hypothetical protein